MTPSAGQLRAARPQDPLVQQLAVIVHPAGLEPSHLQWIDRDDQLAISGRCSVRMVRILEHTAAGQAAAPSTHHKAGKSVAIIEKDETYVGGISRTVEHDGYRFDIGGHRFFSKSQQVVDLWNEILPDDFIERPRMSRIYYEGKFYSYPLRAFEALRNLGLWRSTLCMASYLWARAFPNRNVKSFEDWTTNQFGKKLYSIFFKTYTEKVWGMPCDEMSADWAAQRIKGLSLMGAVVDGLKRSLGLNKKPNDGMQAKTLLDHITRSRHTLQYQFIDMANLRPVCQMHALLTRQFLIQLFGKEWSERCDRLSQAHEHIVKRLIGVLFVTIVFTLPEATT